MTAVPVRNVVPVQVSPLFGRSLVLLSRWWLRTGYPDPLSLKNPYEQTSINNYKSNN